MVNEKMLALGKTRSVIREIFEYGKRRKAQIGEDSVFDFSLGNPSVEPPQAVTEELVRLLSETDSVTLHGYTSAQGDYSVREAIAESIKMRHKCSIDADDLYLTVGAAAALTSTLTAVVCEGEEVIVLAPYFPEYKVFIERCKATVRAVSSNPDTFQPDIKKIEEAINRKTAAIIVNSPNNPTGAVITEENIKALSELLERKSAELKKTIYLIADEPYRELVYDGAFVPYIPNYYKNTIVCYSYSKSLSIPGERIGYVFVPKSVDSSREVYAAVMGAGRALGYVCAPSLVQKLLPYCLDVTADIGIYDKNRKLLLSELTSYGFSAVKPDGAFYLFLKSPNGDAEEFTLRAREYELLLVPSDSFGCSGYVRISYCVKTEQIEKSLPAFKLLAESYGLKRTDK